MILTPYKKTIVALAILGTISGLKVNQDYNKLKSS